MRKFCWGIIGCGVISHKFAEALACIDNAFIGAVSNRTPAKAQDFAKKHGVATVYADYRDLLADERIDAVYIAATNTDHYGIVKDALHRKKPVLCEKPFTVTLAEAEELVAIARAQGVFLAENLWTKHLPIYRELKKLMEEKTIGELRVVHADYFYCAEFDPKDRVFDPEKGGGALLDIGIYGLVLIGMFLGYRPTRMVSTCAKGLSGVDERVHVGLSYANGALADMTCAISTPAPQQAVVIGTRGRIEIPSFGRAVSATVHTYGDEKIGANSLGAGTRSSFPAGGKTWQISAPFRKNGFEYILEAAMDAIRSGALELPLASHEEMLAWIRLKERAMQQWEQDDHAVQNG